MTARYIVGDVRQVLAAMPARSVDLVLTSPPFLALRSYLPADHPDKQSEIGSEATPGEFIDTLLDVVEACARVLAPHGSMCIELGDTYSDSGGAGGDYAEGGLHDGQPVFKQGRKFKSGVLPKSLCLIPELFRISLVYGTNPLTGRQTPRWRARNVVRWVRPNPPVGALGDKYRPATSEMVIICKERKRYFDLDAVRHPADDQVMNPLGDDGQRIISNPAGAPPLDWWKISTQPYAGSHYATWPEQLCITPIKSMCPLKVCRVCGKPSERIVETLHERSVNDSDCGKDRTQGRHSGGAFVKSHTVVGAIVETVGWTDCGHNDWRTGVTLDPFGGSGTTLAVATGHGRDAIGIDLDGRNAELALDRVGPLMLTVEHHKEVAA